MGVQRCGAAQPQQSQSRRKAPRETLGNMLNPRTVRRAVWLDSGKLNADALMLACWGRRNVGDSNGQERSPSSPRPSEVARTSDRPRFLENKGLLAWTGKPGLFTTRHPQKIFQHNWIGGKAPVFFDSGPLESQPDHLGAWLLIVSKAMQWSLLSRATAS